MFTIIIPMRLRLWLWTKSMEAIFKCDGEGVRMNTKKHPSFELWCCLLVNWSFMLTLLWNYCYCRVARKSDWLWCPSRCSFVELSMPRKKVINGRPDLQVCPQENSRARLIYSWRLSRSDCFWMGSTWMEAKPRLVQILNLLAMAWFNAYNYTFNPLHTYKVFLVYLVHD